MSPGLRKTTLLQRATRHLIIIFVLMATLLISTSIIGYGIAVSTFSEIELQELLTMYRARLQEREEHWEQSAVRFRSLIAYMGLLDEPAGRWDRLNSYMSVQGVGQYFSHIMVTGRDGTVLYRYGEGSGRFPVPRPLDAVHGWYLDEESLVLYRVYRQPVVLDIQHQGRLLTFHPFTNSFLLSNCPPRTHLFLKSGSRIVASSLGPDGVERGEQAIGDGHFVSAAITLHDGPEPVRLLVYRQQPELFSPLKLSLLIGSCLLAAYMMLWLGIGSWVLRLSRRVTALGTISRQLEEQSETSVVDRDATGICHEVNDEISLAAAALEQMTAELEEKNRELFSLARHDALTGLPNRLTLLDRLERAISNAQRKEGMLAVVFLDLDRFKEINDTLGHNVGDDLLVQVAGRLLAQVRESDTVARLGGDEFVLLLPEVVDAADAKKVADKLLMALNEPFSSGGHCLRTTPSIGIALYPLDGDDPHTLMKHADAAMYRAKSCGRNNVQYFS